MASLCFMTLTIATASLLTSAFSAPTDIQETSEKLRIIDELQEMPAETLKIVDELQETPSETLKFDKLPEASAETIKIFDESGNLSEKFLRDFARSETFQVCTMDINDGVVTSYKYESGNKNKNGNRPNGNTQIGENYSGSSPTGSSPASLHCSQNAFMQVVDEKVRPTNNGYVISGQSNNVNYLPDNNNLNNNANHYHDYLPTNNNFNNNPNYHHDYLPTNNNFNNNPNYHHDYLPTNNNFNNNPNHYHDNLPTNNNFNNNPNHYHDNLPTNIDGNYRPNVNGMPLTDFLNSMSIPNGNSDNNLENNNDDYLPYVNGMPLKDFLSSVSANNAISHENNINGDYVPYVNGMPLSNFLSSIKNQQASLPTDNNGNYVPYVNGKPLADFLSSISVPSNINAALPNNHNDYSSPASNDVVLSDDHNDSFFQNNHYTEQSPPNNHNDIYYSNNNPHKEDHFQGLSTDGSLSNGLFQPVNVEKHPQGNNNGAFIPSGVHQPSVNGAFLPNQNNQLLPPYNIGDNNSPSFSSKPSNVEDHPQGNNNGAFIPSGVHHPSVNGALLANQNNQLLPPYNIGDKNSPTFSSKPSNVEDHPQGNNNGAFIPSGVHQPSVNGALLSNQNNQLLPPTNIGDNNSPLFPSKPSNVPPGKYVSEYVLSHLAPLLLAG